MSDKPLPPALSRLLEKASAHRKAGDQLVFSGQLHDPIPRYLIVDPDLPATAVRIWAYLRSYIQDNHSSTVCPTYKDMMHSLGLGSKSTVSINLALLRATRWLSVKEKLKNHRGYFGGSIYILHTEPVSVSDAIILDEEYMQILIRLSDHTNPKYHRLASGLLIVAEQLFDQTESSTLGVIDQRVDAGRVRNPRNQKKPGTSMLGQFYQRRPAGKANYTKEPSINNVTSTDEGNNVTNDDINKISVLQTKINALAEPQNGGQTLATILDQPKKPKSSGKSENSGKNETKKRIKHGGQTLATPENHPGPKYGPGTESNNWTPFCSSSFNKNLTTTNNKGKKEQKDKRGPYIPDQDIFEYDFHDQYLNFTQNQKHLARISLDRIDLEYRQMVLDEVAARVKMTIEKVNPSQQPVGSALAYVKWQCNEILNGRNALTGRHPDDVVGGKSARSKDKEEREIARQQQEKALARAHDARIARLLKKQNQDKK